MPSAPTISFIGAGKMATAIALGAIRSGLVQPAQILASSPGPSRLAFAEATGARVTQDNRECLAAPLVILACKPQKAREVCLPLAGLAAPDTHFVSVIAGLSATTLSSWLASDRISRSMPNTPLSVGEGSTGIAFAPAVGADQRQTVLRLLSASGLALEVPEQQIDLVTAISGSGPAYFFEIAAAIIEWAEAKGLDPAIALALSAQTLVGSGRMLLQAHADPVTLRNAVTSPNGTTAAALASFSHSGLRPAFHAALDAAQARAAELGAAANASSAGA